MPFFWAIVKAFPLGDILKALIQNWPAVEALLRYIEQHEDDKKRAAAMDAISRGFQNAKETGDTSALEKAVRDHCPSSGCRIP